MTQALIKRQVTALLHTAEETIDLGTAINFRCRVGDADEKQRTAMAKKANGHKWNRQSHETKHCTDPTGKQQ